MANTPEAFDRLIGHGKIPPQALDIEEAILGALLIDPMGFARVSHYFNTPVFYKEAHQIILDTIRDIHDKGGAVDILTVADKLRASGRLDEIGGSIFLAELTTKIASSAHLSFHCMIITDKFLLRELIRIGTEMAKRAYNEEDPSIIAEWVEEQITEKFDLDKDGRASFKDALQSTLRDIAKKAEGLISSFIKTGDPELDSKISFRERQICLIAGPEGCGKTKFVTYIVKLILDNNENIRVLWFSMEDSKEQIIRSFISMEAGLTTKQLQSINYKLSEEELAKIHDISEKFNDYKIEFIDQVSSIRTIMRRGRAFKDKYKDDTVVIIVDNLGLISTDSFFKGIEKDDYLAGKIKELSDTTGSSIFVLHHITKESAKRFNLEEGYRPRKEYIKGSTRILDYVQQALLVNLPRKYKDLIAEEKTKSTLYNVKEKSGPFDKTRFLMELWSINPKGDKFTKNIPDLPEETWKELKYHCTIYKKPDGTQMGAGYILKKYVEYSAFIDDKNKGRESKYHTEKMSIHTFINQRKYSEDYSPQKSSRSYYLYGGDLSVSRHINNLFIVESVKNRDGSDVEDESIIRYHANLDHNIFIPIIENEQN